MPDAGFSGKPDQDKTQRAPPGKLEATAVAVAGVAFATSTLFLRRALGVAPGLFDATAAILVAMGLSLWAHRLGGAPMATLARGAGLVVGTLVLARSLVPPFDKLVVPAAVAIAAVAVLQANAQRGAPRLVDDGVGVALLLAAVALGFLAAPGIDHADRLRFALVLAAGASLAGLAARRALLATRFAGFAPQPLGIVLVAALAASYLSYRPLVRENVGNLPLYEWSAAAMAGGLVLARLRRRAKEREAPEAWSATARRHAQDVRPVYDERMGPLAVAIGRWLDRGEGFDEYKAAMESRGARVDEAARALAGGRTKGARRDLAAQRLAAHEAALRTLPSRGPLHGIRA